MAESPAEGRDAAQAGVPLAPALNVGLRGLSLVSRFALLFALARLVPPEVLGEFGLLSATITFAILLVGADFYTYSTRELLASPRAAWPGRLRDHGAFTLLLSSIAGPALAAVLYLSPLPRGLLWLSLLLFVFELACQELNRLLVAMHRPLVASLVLFLRTGAWVWFAIAIMVLAPTTQRLTTVLLAWLVGTVLAVAVGAGSLFRLPWQSMSPRIDWLWIRRGLRVAATYLLATICLRAILTVDRYLVAWAADVARLGAYTLYAGIAFSLVSVLDSGVFAFMYPRVVAAAAQQDRVLFNEIMRQMFFRALVVVLCFAIAAIALIFPVLGFVTNDIYSRHLPVYFLLLLGACSYGLGLVPHYGLYATKRDRAIVRAHALGLAVFLAVSVGAVQLAPLMGVALSLVVALSSMSLFKAAVYLRRRDWSTA